MNKPVRLLVVSLLLASPAFCQTSQEITNLQQHGFETNLSSGAILRLHLHDGDFHVLGSDSEKVSIHVEGKNMEQAKNIKIQLKRSGSAVDLTLSHVPKKELQVTIEVPRSTNLYARMRGVTYLCWGLQETRILSLREGT